MDEWVVALFWFFVRLLSEPGSVVAPYELDPDIIAVLNTCLWLRFFSTSILSSQRAATPVLLFGVFGLSTRCPQEALCVLN